MQRTSCLSTIVFVIMSLFGIDFIPNSFFDFESKKIPIISLETIDELIETDRGTFDEYGEYEIKEVYDLLLGREILQICNAWGESYAEVIELNEYYWKINDNPDWICVRTDENGIVENVFINLNRNCGTI